MKLMTLPQYMKNVKTGFDKKNYKDIESNAKSKAGTLML